MLDRRAFLTALAGAAACRPAAAASPAPDGMTLVRREARYWPLYEEALANERAGSGNLLNVEMLDQAWAILGEECRAMAERAKIEAGLAAWRAAHPDRAPPPPPPSELEGVEDALDAIAAEARGRRVVILNEDHSLSRNRAFAAALAVRLRAEGFNWFAAEDLKRPDLAPSDLIAPNIGFYVTDPVYAELLRVVRDLRYRTAVYDLNSVPDSATERPEAKQRDYRQAANLIANVLDKDPAARVLVYAGHGHGREGADPNGYRSLGAWLPELAGIDPLTIDQSRGVPELSPEQDHPALAEVLKTFQPTGPVAARVAGGGWRRGGLGRMDMAVFFPRVADVEGRPGWLAQAPERRMARWTLSGPPADEGFLQAVPEAEAAAGPAVPSDQVRLEPGARTAVFFLRPGRYRVRLDNAAGLSELGTLSV